jgi:hypothetical protein
MKIKFLLMAIAFLLTQSLLFAQRPVPHSRGESRERIEAQRIGFITQKLQLTPDEAAKFWPIYNEHKDQLKEMRDDFERPDLMNVSEDEARAIIERHLQQEEKRLEMKRTLFNRLRSVVGAKKVLLLQAAEKEFNRELLRRANTVRPQ